MRKKEPYKRKHDVGDEFKEMYDRIMNPYERKKARRAKERKERLKKKKKDLGLNL